MSAAPAIAIDVHPEALRATVRQSRFDEAVCEEAQREIPAAAARNPGVAVVLDLSGVDYMPSLGLGALVGLMRSLRQAGHRFILAGVTPEAREVLTITRLDKLFEMRASF